MKKFELVFIPLTGIGHLASMVEFAKILIDRDHRFSITVIIMPSPFANTSTTYIESISNTITGIRFIELPIVHPPPSDNEPGFKSEVRAILTDLKSNSVSLAGLVVDMFMIHMIEVASELGMPTYLYFTSGAAMLCFSLYLPTLDTQIATNFKDYPGELTIPGYVNPHSPLYVPPSLSTRNDGYNFFLDHARKFVQPKGIIINTLYEVEPFAVDSLANGTYPPVYPVGPLLDTQTESIEPKYEHIMKWLDDQPPSSVIFLCFGSRGSFSEPQVKEIAMGLEQCGYHFLWALRQPPAEKFGMSTDYANFKDVLPDGFLDRTSKRGIVCGWAPQVSLLAHKAIGGFVSHCGWNSILESLWYGVPILTWPLYAEQTLNAFALVKDLGLAVELRVNYIDGVDLITAEEIKRGVKCVMDNDSVVRRKVTAMKEISRTTKSDGGSSFASLKRFIQDVTERVDV
ncbi:hypothetical protein GIB67_016027 [Kingdonia uniflora]|uniref:Glycosyltransferase n=1 Tax=Kingdonia uniflora TaxID=39325 RepID=A0A7J7L1R3_9MAGN|nr:hypothetical protein GIB67_016027 [Kingdonia uniflora]